MADTKYIFTSKRLGFRNWKPKDREKMYEISSDPAVMEFFPSILCEQENDDFIHRMIDMYEQLGYCYFAVEELLTEEFIGFIGIARQSFESDFTPCIDVGYRLKKNAWNKGYAKEGAKRCLEYGFNDLKLSKIYAIAVEVNKPSISVMIKVGMNKERSFIHPKLINDERLRNCVLFSIENSI